MAKNQAPGRAISSIMLAILITSMVIVALNIQAARASEIIIDTDGSAYFSKYPSGPYWYHRTDSGAYNGNFWYTYCSSPGVPEYLGAWTASLSGAYEVFVFVPNPVSFSTYNPTYSAKYAVTFQGGGYAERIVNQALRLGGWLSIGSFMFDGTAGVILNDNTGEPYASKMVAFDAIKFVSVNNPPYTPSSPSPTNGVSGVSTSPVLSWSGGDPDSGDTVTYNVYFGTSSSPPLVSSGQSATTYSPGTLSYSTTYYWKIVSTDNHGSSTSGPVWFFVTQSAPIEHRVLTVYSTPGGVVFTADGSTHTTPWSGTYNNGESVSLVMPSIYSTGDPRYYWDRWSDGVTSQSRTVTLNSDTILTANYVGPYYELIVASSPISGIPFTVNGISKATSYSEWLYQGYYNIEMPATHNEYLWQHWEDGDTNRVKNVLLTTSTMLTAVYSTPEGPRANFGYSPADPSVNSAISFDATYATPEGKIKSYVWVFDDGLTDSGIKPTHSFCDAKTHSVSLTITDDYERTDTRTVEIPVRLYKDPSMGPAIEKKLEYANMDASRRMAMYDIIKQVLNVEQIRAQHDMKPQELIFSYLNVLLRQFDQSQQDIYVNEIDAIREYALSENQGLAVSAEGVIASGLFVALGAVPSPLLGSVLSEAAKRLGFFIGEQLVLSDIWSATITYPGTGRMEVVYRLSASKILVSAYLEEPINRNIFIIIPVKLEPMRTSWGTGFCPLSTGINCPPEYAIRELVPKMGDVTIVSGFSPIELRVFDLQGRVTGLVSGVVKAEIPESGYVDDTVVIFSADSPYLYQSGGECSAAYGLQITFVKDENATDFFAADIPTSAMQIHNYTVDWAVLSPGGEGVTVKVDCEGDGDFEYAFTSDSELSRIEYVAATTQHDLGITGITSSKSVTGEGYSLPINMTTINYGVYTETFNVSFYVNTTLVESQTVTLASGNSTTITFTWNTTDALYGNYALSAYAEPVLNETYVADNNCTWIVHVGVPGDVSSTTPGVYDGVTNMKDIAYMVALFNTRPESPNWNPNADVNNDGVCNMKDIAICVAYFNQRE